MTRIETLRRLLSSPKVAIFAPILGVVLLLPSLGVGWQVDDLLHRTMLLGPPPDFPMGRATLFNLFSFTGYEPGANARLIDYGAMPWYTLPECRLSFFRPVTILTHMLDYKLWPNSGPLMHVHSLLWYAGVVAVAGALYRRLMPQLGAKAGAAGTALAAGIATIFFAIDDAHAMPAGWIANRNSLITALFGFVAILAHDTWRRDERRSMRRFGAVLGPLALALALLSGEAAVAACGYLFAYALCIDRSSFVRRWGALLPYILIGAVWTIVYKKLGYGAYGSEVYIDPATEFGRFAKAFAYRAPILLLGQFGLPPPDLSILFTPPGLAILVGFAAVFLALLGIVLFPILKRDAVARFWLVGMLLSIIPISATFPSGRLMLYTSLGGFGLVGQFLAARADREPWLPASPVWRRLATVFAALFIVIHGVISPLSAPGVSGAAKALGTIFTNAAAEVPDDPSVTKKHLIILNVPTPFISAYVMLGKMGEGKPHAARLRTLTTSNDELLLSRLDEKTLSVRPSRGMFPPPWPESESSVVYSIPLLDLGQALENFNLITRSRSHPMRLGEKIVLTGVTFEISELTKDGRPAEFRVTFDRPLEDPSLIWMQWNSGGGGKLVPFTPPRVGETMKVPPVPLLF